MSARIKSWSTPNWAVNLKASTRKLSLIEIEIWFKVQKCLSVFAKWDNSKEKRDAPDDECTEDQKPYVHSSFRETQKCNFGRFMWGLYDETSWTWKEKMNKEETNLKRKCKEKRIIWFRFFSFRSNTLKIWSHQNCLIGANSNNLNRNFLKPTEILLLSISCFPHEETTRNTSRLRKPCIFACSNHSFWTKSRKI